MSAHVSQLVLDELASGLQVPPEQQTHLEGCAHCAERLTKTKAARSDSEKAFGYARVKARVTAERPSKWRELMPFLLPVVAAAVFLFIIRIDFGKPGDTERLKGGASIELVTAEGLHVTQARPGTRLSLELGTAGNTHAFVIAVDKDRQIDQLFAGELPPGAIVRLPKDVEVTPGSVTVHAFLARSPLDAKTVVTAMEDAIREYAGWPLEAPPPKLDGVTVTSQRLYVNP